MSYQVLLSENNSMFGLFKHRKKSEQAQKEAAIKGNYKELFDKIEETTSVIKETTNKIEITNEIADELYKEGGMTQLIYAALGSGRKK